MKRLKVGQVVMVHAESIMGYGWDDTKVDYNVRRVQSWPLLEPRVAVITGKAVKQLGNFIDPPPYRYSEDWDHRKGHFKVTGTVTLWTVRVGYTNKELLVKDEYLEVYNRPFELPHTGRRLMHVPMHDPLEGEADDKPVEVKPQLSLPKNSTLLRITDQSASPFRSAGD